MIVPHSLHWGRCVSARGLFALLGVVLCLIPASTRGGTLRTQQIQLQKGWNSVFLEVFPSASAPEDAFLNTPVSIVAAHFPLNNAVEFVTDPSKTNWKKEGWGVWYAPGREDAFLSNLHSIDGGRAYLIYAERDFLWQVEGNVLFERRRWKANSFNLAGFGVDEVAPPTFGKFFAGSKAHAQPRIYRLVNDRWAKVTAPDATLMKCGEACWVYCQGPSDYQGPLSVTLPAGGTGVAFASAGSGQTSIVLGNSSTDPMILKADCGNGGLPVSYVLKGLAQDHVEEVFVDLTTPCSLSTLEAGARTSLKLQVRRERMGQNFQSSLMKISADNGVRVWLPLAAQRQDLSSNP